MKKTTELDSRIIKLEIDGDTVYFLHVKDKNNIDSSYRISSNDWLFKWLENINA
jgi:hypothetical protein